MPLPCPGLLTHPCRVTLIADAVAGRRFLSTVSASSPSSAASDAPRPWRVSPVDPSKVLFERTVKECYKNIALMAAGGRPVRPGLFNRLLTKCVSDVRVGHASLYLSLLPPGALTAASTRVGFFIGQLLMRAGRADADAAGSAVVYRPCEAVTSLTRDFCCFLLRVACCVVCAGLARVSEKDDLDVAMKALRLCR